MDRRKMLKYLGISPAVLTGFPAGAETTRARVPSANGGSHEEGMITVMIPHRRASWRPAFLWRHPSIASKAKKSTWSIFLGRPGCRELLLWSDDRMA